MIYWVLLIVPRFISLIQIVGFSEFAWCHQELVGQAELRCTVWVRCDCRSSQHIWYLNVWKDIWWPSSLFKSVKTSVFATVQFSHAPQVTLFSHIQTRSKNCEKRQLPSSCLPLRPVRLSFHPSSWNNSVLTGRIFTKFNTIFFENLSRKFKFH